MTPQSFQESDETLLPYQYTDDDLELLYRQEPLPPNQSPQLNAEEQLIEENYAEH